MLSVPVIAAALTVSLACGGGEGTQDTTAMGAPPPGGAPGGAAAGGDFTEQQITPAMIALGDSIFRGTAAAGICYTCHGPEANGTQLGPNLTDQEWLHGDGGLAMIMGTVRNGITQPKQYPGVMPPFSAQFSEEQIRAVSAYVYAKSHPNFRPGGGD